MLRTSCAQDPDAAEATHHTIDLTIWYRAVDPAGFCEAGQDVRTACGQMSASDADKKRPTEQYRTRGEEEQGSDCIGTWRIARVWYGFLSLLLLPIRVLILAVEAAAWVILLAGSCIVLPLLRARKHRRAGR